MAFNFITAVCAFDDNADGNAYKIETIITPVTDAFTCALRLLRHHDHVCILDYEDYITVAESKNYKDYAPYSLFLHVGSKAKL